MSFGKKLVTLYIGDYKNVKNHLQFMSLSEKKTEFIFFIFRCCRETQRSTTRHTVLQQETERTDDLLDV